MIDAMIREDINKINGDLKGNIFEGKTVLVTGGAGFIGSWLCDVLVNIGAEVTCIDDLSTGLKENVDHLLGNSRFRLLVRDVSKFHSSSNFDFILHMAGHASPEEYQVHPIETLQASSLGSFNMAELARKNDATIMFASTSEVYGDAEVVPTPEDYWGKVNPIGPRSCYDEGKRFAEALFLAYYRQYGLGVKIPRIFNSYGPRLREDGLYGRAMSRFTLQALTNSPITIYGNGGQTRSFCYITDTAVALMLLLACDEASGEVVNIGNSRELTILELAKKIKILTRCNSSFVFHPLPEDDPKRRCPNTLKLQRLTGWKPKVDFATGIERMVKWFSTKKIPASKKNCFNVGSKQIR